MSLKKEDVFTTLNGNRIVSQPASRERNGTNRDDNNTNSNNRRTWFGCCKRKRRVELWLLLHCCSLFGLTLRLTVQVRIVSYIHWEENVEVVVVVWWPSGCLPCLYAYVLASGVSSGVNVDWLELLFTVSLHSSSSILLLFV